MRFKPSYSLRTLFTGFTVVGLLAGGIMSPIYAYRQEQAALRELSIVANVVRVDETWLRSFG